MSLRPVILCGGAGTRLWPMSRPDRPKPLLPLATDASLLADTLARAAPLGEPWLVCGAAHAHAIGLEAPGHLRIVEPTPRGTAPAAVAAACLALEEDPDATLLLVPADHAVEPPEAFLATVARGRALADDGFLVTFGIEPRSASSQVGWIEMGDELGAGRAIVRFVEKPRAAEAEKLRKAGAVWNSGMFLARADRLLEEVRAADADLVPQVRAALAEAKHKKRDRRLLLGPSFAEAREVSVDVLVMQSTRRGAVVPATFRWADLGTWPSVREARGGRAGGQVLSDGQAVEVLGDPDVLVAVTGGAVLVATPEAADQVRGLRVPNPALLDRGPGWRVERRTVGEGERFDGEGTAIVLAGRVAAGRKKLGPGAVIPAGGQATTAGTWLVVRAE